MANEAYVFDAVRTPRGKGKDNGSLARSSPSTCSSACWTSCRGATSTSTPRGSTTSCSACVSPVGDQGSDIARTAVLKAGLPDTVAGVQLNRFCASGLEAVNIAAQKVALRLGGPGLRRRRRVDVARADGLRRRRLGEGPGDQLRRPPSCPQGIGADLIATIEGFSRDDVDAYAAASQERAARPGPRAASPARWSRCGTATAWSCWSATSSSARARPSKRCGAEAVVREDGRGGGFDAVALQKYHWVERIDHVHTPATPPASSTARRWCRSAARQAGERRGLTPAGADRRRPRSAAPTRRSC